MLLYYSDIDELYTIGIYAVHKSHNIIKKHIEDIICNDLVHLNDNEEVDDNDFNHDTIIIKPNQFDESFLDIVNKGVYLYIRG